MSAAPRSLAAKILGEVLARGVPLGFALNDHRLAQVAPADRGLVKALCYGTLRRQPLLAAILRRLLKRGLKRGDEDVQALLLLGLYQLTALRVPAHAAVAETVEAARALGKPWASGLVNGVLRTFQRRENELLRAADADEESRLNHPRWFIEGVRREWPAQWRDILAANDVEPPLTIRINRRRGARASAMHELAGAGFVAQPCRYATDGLVLETPVSVEVLPGFSTGRLSVQDSAAQLAVEVLDLAPGQRVLDACAAPGGKTCHILEREPKLLELVAVDKDRRRLERVRENLARLQLSANTLVGDATHPEAWWDGVPFARILLDAPCSGSGVIRRHPDIKLLRTPEQVRAAVSLQSELLARLWHLLAPDGKLIYVTCSIFGAENAARIAAFIAANNDARPCPIAADWGQIAGAGRQVLPGEDGMDGFYYACIEKMN